MSNSSGNSEKENKSRIDKAARDVLTLARNTLMVNLRFLDIALSRLDFVPVEEGTIATDGTHLYYDPVHVLRRFKQEKELPARDYLHAILHCIFSHMFVGTLMDQELWNLACDIAVENTINDLGLRSTGTTRQIEQQQETNRLKNKINMLTAEKTYHYFRENGLSESELKRLQKLFGADDHSSWYGTPSKHADTSYAEDGNASVKEVQILEPDQDGKAYGEREQDGMGDPRQVDNSSNKQQGTQLDGISEGKDRIPAEGTEEDWKNIAEKIQEDLETFSKEHGDAAGGMVQNLNAVNRERYNYESFLRKFAVPGEAMVINDDEFDYIFYTYGLKLYDNLPLIEPLEYKEVNRIREFVIAIDTSGSTSGELVDRFIQKTYNILKSTESYFSRVNIHIIQCDSAIQEHVKITSAEEFDDYLKNMQIHGLGGTDFRPVFSFVDSLVKEGEFTNLKGLIYFTDGYGTFPSQMPDYLTAFVFVDNDYNNPIVPPWAIKLVLQNDEI